MTKQHLREETQTKLGHHFYRIKNDVNGNPRYVISWMAFGSNYDAAKVLANAQGFKVYRGRNFGGGFVCQSYNLERTAQWILKKLEECNQ